MRRPRAGGCAPRARRERSGRRRVRRAALGTSAGAQRGARLESPGWATASALEPPGMREAAKVMAEARARRRRRLNNIEGRRTCQPARARARSNQRKRVSALPGYRRSSAHGERACIPAERAADVPVVEAAVRGRAAVAASLVRCGAQEKEQHTQICQPSSSSRRASCSSCSLQTWKRSSTDGGLVGSLTPPLTAPRRRYASALRAHPVRR